MNDPNVEQLRAAAALLQPLLARLVFVGGCATGLLITDQAAGDVRPTKDVDAIAEVSSYAAYAALADELRALGLTEDVTEGAPLCRWKHADLIIDVMPDDERALGFSNPWYSAALASAETRALGHLRLRVITPVYFLATKLVAFRGRGQGDVSSSPDLEDLVAVVDGRPEIVGEVGAAAPAVRAYIASDLRELLGQRAFLDGLSGFLLPDVSSQARRPLLLERLKAVAGLITV